MSKLWVESHRPATLDGYVFADQAQKETIEGWVKEKSIPQVLLSGGPGCGKTTLAKILVNLLEVDPFDFMEINASRENGIDTIRDKITNFVQTMPFGDFKVVLLDEFDFMSPNAQASMRHMMEAYHQTARFILTCNYPHKIIPAIHSRCQGFHIDKLDATEFTARVATVLVEEGVDFDLDTLDNYVRSTYPDLRKCLNNLQMNSTGGKLISPRQNDRSSSDWKLSAVELFKSGKPTEARKLICSSVRQDEMDEVFRWCYDNLDLWTTDVYKQDEAITIIRDGLVNVPFVGDQEINLSATLVELAQLTRS
jgi:replication factor C small subunit